ncbi:polyphosphate kinase 1 [Albibacterium indicum]|uniref:polyphosphate kinase 1 n=1 Tax=Albibacterium indicum TaxID=2292082 RepID=UPI000E4803F8|nr:polyphosphate kinase 1 [Pedobacter indicus]
MQKESQIFFNRDLSWLSFNERILDEAAKEDVPLLERINFLAIYSSNLDEFYRVRMPVLSALRKIKKQAKQQHATVPESKVHKKAKKIILQNQQRYGEILTGQVIPEMKKSQVYLAYNEGIPSEVLKETENYFYSRIVSSLEIVRSEQLTNFFPENNQLYFLVALNKVQDRKLVIVKIPSGEIGRFFQVQYESTTYIIFIDDIIRHHLPDIFRGHEHINAFSFKVTREAELDLENEYEGDIAKKIEEQLEKRDYGLATRILYQSDMPKKLLTELAELFSIPKISTMPGGRYHNLKDFFSFPVDRPAWKNIPQPPLAITLPGSPTLFESIQKQDMLISTPYQSYDTVLRFFNEAVINEDVEKIYTTIYRVAESSRILQALISAAKNGKKVTVFVELKARFDEGNNLKWAREMQKAGIKVLYTIPKLKVHAKVALIKQKSEKHPYLTLFSTGNLNENTATVYADHILLTAHREMGRELEQVFFFLSRRRRVSKTTKLKFEHLLVAQFNLTDVFIASIDQEIENAKAGLFAEITIKLNNLEEKNLINKLYEANNAGVKINLIIRSICRLIPGVHGMSEHISVRRIVDRYLEHSRVFIFNNNGDEQMYMGSADWMNRNIHNRIEVCFPIYDKTIKKEIKDVLTFQLNDTESAVLLDRELQNIPVDTLQKDGKNKIRAQKETYLYFKNKKQRKYA